MSSFLSIHVKATGEYFDVFYQLETIIYDLIKYVSTKSTGLLSTNPEDYYMAINNSEVLDNNQSVGEARLNQPDRFTSLEMCIKTRVLMKRFLQAEMQLRQVPINRVTEKTEETAAKQRPMITDRTSSFTTEQQASATIAADSISKEKHPVQLLANGDDINSEVHILVCGGPKVGKSTLINALCGYSVANANTIALDRCTQTARYYQLDNIYFWDTPGIQQWSKLDIDSYLHSSARRQPPLCMFYCASPFSFTRLKQLNMLLDECICRRHIFCVLVVTNMFSGANRYVILDEFKALLNKYVGGNKQVREEQGVWYYGQIGLCTMVNSQEYVNEDTNRPQPQQGVDELILALMKSLGKSQQLNDWLRTIETNRQFWLDNQEELYRLTNHIT